MYQNDFIKRMIEQLGFAIARLLGLAQNGQGREALAELDNLLSSVSGFSPAQLELFEPETLRQLLGTERCTAVLQLWNARAEVLDSTAQATQAKVVRARAEGLRAHIATAQPAR